jgi:effector-binding domain-containing protein
MEVTFLGATLLEITFDKDAKTTIFLKALFSKNDKSKVIQISKTSVLNYCWLYLTHKNPNYNIAQNLKNYFNTPMLFYGYKIVKTGVVDTDFVTLSKVVLKQKTYTTAFTLQQSLFDYAKKNDLKCLDYPFLIIYPKTADSAIVTSMLTIIDKKIGYNTQVNYLPMPKNGKMLIGYFKGEYRKRSLLYNAMEKYIARNGTIMVANSFEKFLNKKLPKNDSSVVDMALYYPIY